MLPSQYIKSLALSGTSMTFLHFLHIGCTVLLTVLTASPTLLRTADAHMSMVYPVPRGLPSNPNTAFIDFDCRDAPLYDGCGGGVGKTYPCGGYPPDKQIIQTFHAGEVINVRFGNAQYGAPGQQDLTPSSNQARHSGGLCEFSVSYDQGKTFGVVGRYHHSCPDIFYDWPVKLPANLPSCENCIFAWSWINAFTTAPEFYMGCADIQIIGRQESVVAVAAANLTPIRIANIPGYPYYHAPGDQFGNTKSDGPNVAEIDTNMASAAGEQDVSFQPMYSLRKRDRLAFRQRFPPPNR